MSDNGSGMTEEAKAKAFEPFFTTKGLGRGTGLGLATCYGIVKQAGGHIAIYSEVGVGTTMKVYLPALSSEVGETKKVVAAPVAGGAEAILLVEDEAAVREIALKMLEKQGYRVRAVANAEEALDLLRRDPERIDLLLTDVVLPGINGKLVAEQARALRPALRVLFASGYTDDVALRNRIIDEGAVLVNKPFTSQTLGAKVREVLDSER